MYFKIYSNCKVKTLKRCIVNNLDCVNENIIKYKAKLRPNWQKWSRKEMNKKTQQKNCLPDNSKEELK